MRRRNPTRESSSADSPHPVTLTTNARPVKVVKLFVPAASELGSAALTCCNGRLRVLAVTTPFMLPETDYASPVISLRTLSSLRQCSQIYTTYGTPTPTEKKLPLDLAYSASRALHLKLLICYSRQNQQHRLPTCQSLDSHAAPACTGSRSRAL